MSRAAGLRARFASLAARKVRLPPHRGAGDAAPELEAVLASLRLALFQGSSSDEEILANAADWPGVVALARRHEVSAFLLQALRARPALLAHAGVEAKLRAHRNGAVHTGWQQLGALKRAGETLHAKDIRYLVLKGLPLAQRTYGHPLARAAADIDVLVAPEQFDAAREALVAAGYRLQTKFPETPTRRRWHMRIAQNQDFIGHGASIELHWRLCGNPHLFGMPFDQLHERRGEVAIAGRPYATLGADDELLYLMCHGAGHGWASLKWLCDVAMILRGMDAQRWRHMAARCQAEGLEAVLAATVELCRTTFRLDLPAMPSSRRGAFIARKGRLAWAARDIPSFRQSLPLKLALKARPRYLSRELSRLAIAPQDWQRVNLPDSLFYLYFALRPLLWLHGALESMRRAAASRPPRQREQRHERRASAGPRGTGSGSGEGLGAPAAERGPPPRVNPQSKARTLHGWIGARALAAEAIFLLAVARVLIKHVPLRHWRRWLVTGEHGTMPRKAPRGHISFPVHRVVRVVAKAADLVPFPALCLPQAIVAQWMLRRRGVPSRITFGVRTGPGSAGAAAWDFHAWLSAEGRCATGCDGIGSYAPLPPFDGLPAAPRKRERSARRRVMAGGR